jgi:CBS domain-containing protein
MRAREIMVSPVVTVREDCALEEAAKLMFERNVGCLIVVNEQGDACGIVTESDFAAKEKAIPFSVARFPQVLGEWMPTEGVERVYSAARRIKVRDIMTRDLVTLNEDDTLETVLKRMLETGYHRLPILKGRKPMGMVGRHDLLKLFLTRVS